MKAYSVIIFRLGIPLLLSSCNMPSAAAPAQTSQVLITATWTPIASPTETPAPTSAPATTIVGPPLVTETPVATPGECLGLLVPSEGVVYPADKNIKFVWEALPGAAKHLLEITNMSGWLLSIETAATGYEISSNMFPGEMKYSWNVIALDFGGKQICRAGPGSFSIIIRKSYPTEKPDKNDQGNPRDGSGSGDSNDEGGDWDNADPFSDW